MTPSWYCHSLLGLRAGKLKPYQAFNFSVMILLWKQARLWEVPEAISSIPVCRKRIKVSCKLEVWAAFLIALVVRLYRKRMERGMLKSIVSFFSIRRWSWTVVSPPLVGKSEKKKGKRKTKSLPIYTCVKNVFFKFFDGHVFSSRVRCIEIEASLSLARVYTTQPICILHLNLSRNSIWEINLFTIQIWNYRNTLKIKINSQANIWI